MNITIAAQSVTSHSTYSVTILFFYIINKIGIQSMRGSSRSTIHAFSILLHSQALPLWKEGTSLLVNASVGQ